MGRISDKKLFEEKGEIQGEIAQHSAAFQGWVDDQNKMQRLWGMAFGGGNRGEALNEPTLPEGKMVVAVFMGSRSSGGYAVEIKDVKEEDGKLVVEYQEHAPGPDMMTTCVMTSPFALKMVDKSDLPVEFKKIEPKKPSFGARPPRGPGF